MKGVSIIVPAYNEARIIGANMNRLLSHMERTRPRVRYEIIVADNGSDDRTPEIIAALGKNHKKINAISLPKRGVGRAFKAAAIAARYGKLVSVDADLAIDLGFIGKCVKLLDSNSMVVGSKIIGSQKRPLLRRLLSTGLILMTRTLLGLKLTDYSIGAKGYRRSDVMRCLGDIDAGSFYVTALAYRISKSGKRIVEVPVVCKDTRPSKFNLGHEVLYRFRSLIAFWLRERLA